ncbi:sigma-70 family RNA polymerase sigma factor [Oscillospiraceae bacterium LTW-04]|nr:sigma-70 family RNA polymerase sigma factor [Oscillospiraceae bacterium MB24-C1]
MAVDLAQQKNSIAQSTITKAAGENGLLERYLPMVHSRANAFRQKGVETDDLIQEGVIGLLHAIRAYDHKYGASFETFAYVCITNRLRSAVATASRKLPIVSLESCPPWGENYWKTTQEEDPQEIVINREQLGQWLHRVDTCLSGFEHQVIRYYLGGYSYQEIARLLQSTTKAVDNALQRTRRKLRRL